MIGLMPQAPAPEVLAPSARTPRQAFSLAHSWASRLAGSGRFAAVEVLEDPDDLAGPDPDVYEVAVLAVLAESERSFWISWRVPRRRSWGRQGRVFAAEDGVGACPVALTKSLLREIGTGYSARSA